MQCVARVDLLPTTSPECSFSSDVLGEWLLAEVDGLQKVTVTTGMVTLSQLGEFVCKGKHWNINYYKLMSYYSNGWYASHTHAGKHCVCMDRISQRALGINKPHVARRYYCLGIGGGGH